MHRLTQRPAAWAIAIAAAATAAVLRNDPGRYVADNRFEQYWNPGRRILRGVTLWDGTRGLGRVREELWPGATLPIGLFRLFGASPALAEHLWHAALLTAAGTGCVALLRRFRPVLGPEHALAAALYMFGPFSATFLVPSNLFFHYALTPWLLVVAHRGICGEGGWRSPAAFALLVFAAGNLDTPGLIYALVPLAGLGLHAVAVERRASARAALGFVVRAGVLAVGASAAALAKTVIGLDTLARRLESTETPAVIASASSWSESWRGLGSWVSYFRDAAGPIRPEGAPYFTNVPLVLATFVPAVAGLASLWWARRAPERYLFLGLLLGGTVLMVGAHPADDPTPWGTVWLWSVDHLPLVGTLRSTYKAGTIAALGGALLFGLAVPVLGRAMRDPRGRRVVPVAAWVVVAAVSAPFWQGELYDPDHGLDEVPAYWESAMDWLDARPGSSQVLFLPGATRAEYRWGAPGDDIHDALMDRAHLTDSAVSLSTPLVADTLEAIDDAAGDPTYQRGSLAPVLRRLGIGYVALRNDLDWARMRVRRPAAFDGLRNDPDLVLVASFGQPGQHTVGRADAFAPRERRLPPVEVFAVRGGVARSRVVEGDRWTLLEGGGAGWLAMAAAGILDDPAPVVPTALLGPDQLEAALVRGSRLVVSDTNRRRAQALTAHTSERSRVLPEGGDLDRATPDLYGRPGSQSVVSWEHATSIDDPGVFRTLAGFQPEHRPAQAFDGDLRTAWVVPRLPDPRTRSLEVQLDGPKTVDHIRIVQADPRDPARAADATSSFAGVPRIGRAAIDFSDGTTEHLNLITGRADVRFPARRTTSFVLRILDVTDDGPVGIAEISFPGRPLDLTEHLRVPDDALRLAEDRPSLQQALAAAPTTYLLARDVGPGVVPVEAQLRREVRTVGVREFRVTGGLTWPDASRPTADGEGCVDAGVRIDGEPVRVRLAGRGEAVRFTGCALVELGSGWHRAVGDGDAIVDRLVLSTGEDPVPVGRTLPASVRVSGPTSRHVTLRAPSDLMLISGDGFDDRWRASADGRDLGRPIPADGQTAWVVAAADHDAVAVEVAFGPQRAFDLALALTATTVAGCLAILSWPRRSSR
ncbi:MAG: alpha-(1-_3)-arabinofuranosyltransferase domain-containing protein [Acidimicrobiales bacterium]